MTTREITLFPWDGTTAVKARLTDSHTIPAQDLHAATHGPRFIQRGLAVHMLLVMLVAFGAVGWLVLSLLNDYLFPAARGALRPSDMAMNVTAWGAALLVAVSAVVFLVIPQRKAKAIRRDFEARYQDQYTSLGTVGGRQIALLRALDEAQTTEDRQAVLARVTTDLN